MIKIILSIVLITQIFAFTSQQLHTQQSWNWINASDLTNQEKNVQQWARNQIPSLGAYKLTKAARLGDQLQFHYDGAQNQGWDVITNGGKGDNKFIQRSTFITTQQKPDGTEVIKKKHIVRNDFLDAFNNFA